MTKNEVMQLALASNTALLEVIGNTTKRNFSKALELATRSNKELRTALAQPDKEWVSLTADEISYLALSCHSLKQTADAIEAKLKERNYDK